MGFLRDDRGDVSAYLAGAFMTVFMVFAAGLMANGPRLLGGQQTLAALAQGAAKDVAQQGCLTSSDVTDLDKSLTALGWDANSVTLTTDVNGSAPSGTASYNESVSTTMTYPIPVVVFGAKTPWNWPLTAQGGPEPAQYVLPAGSSNPTCPSWSGAQGSLGTPNAYFFGEDAFQGVSQGSFGTPGSGGSAGTPALTAVASPTTAQTGETVTVSGAATLSGSPEGGLTVDVTPSGGGASGAQGVTDQSGDYSVPLVFTKTGTYAVTAADGLATAQTTVNVVAPSVGTVTASARSPVADGSTGTVYATVTDSQGQPVPDGTKVQVSSTDGRDIPAQTLTTTNGTVAVGVTWSQVGTWTVTFTAGGVSGSAQVTVNPGAAASVAMSAAPNPASAGEAVAISGTVTDAEGNPVAAGTTVTLSSPTDPADFPTRTVTTGSGGAFSASGTFTVAGPQTVTATAGQVSGSATVSVVAAQAASFEDVSLNPDPGQQDSPLAASGTLVDADGNPVAGATVTMTGAGATAATATTASNGSFSAAITPQSTGSQTISLSSGSTSWSKTITVDGSNGYTVQGWTGSPGGKYAVTVDAGTSVTLGATVTGPSGSPESGATVTFYDRLVRKTLGTATTDASGDASLTNTFTQSGTHEVAVTADGAGGLIVVTVNAGPAYAITGYSVNPTSLVAGQGVTASGTVDDQWGNPLANSSVTIKAGSVWTTTATDSTGAFTATLTLTRAGTYGVSASDGAASASRPVTVSPAGPSAVTVTANPTSGSIPFTDTVSGTVTDAYGNPEPSGAVSVSDTCGTSASASLGSSGAYSASVGIDCSGTVTITASDGAASATTTVGATACVEDADGDACNSATSTEPETGGTYYDSDGDASCVGASDEAACTPSESETATYSDSDGDASCSVSDEASCTPAETETGPAVSDADGDASCVPSDEATCTPTESEAGGTHYDADGDASCVAATDESSCTPSESEVRGYSNDDGCLVSVEDEAGDPCYLPNEIESPGCNTDDGYMYYNDEGSCPTDSEYRASGVCDGDGDSCV